MLGAKARKAPMRAQQHAEGTTMPAARSGGSSSGGWRPSMLQLFFWAVYSLLLVLGGMTLGQSTTVKKWSKTLRENGARPAGSQNIVSSAAQARGGHQESGTVEAASSGSSPEHQHRHDELTDGVPGVSDLASVDAAVSAMLGLSSEPPGQPGETYPAPLPAGFYLPPNRDELQRTLGWPTMSVRRPTDEELEGTAFVTMATGDESARHALALLQSMRDCGSRIPTFHVLLFRGGGGSRDCHDPESRRKRKREQAACEGTDTTAVEVVSQVYLDAFQRLGAVVSLDDPIPNTPYIADIPGGRGIAWGMALNKLKVFGMSQYRKILWVDSDVFVLHNIDHLLLEPDFTAAFTTDCCNRNADAKMSGGMWVFHPSQARWARIQGMLAHPVPGSNGEGWLFGDMQVVLYAFARIDKPISDFKEWPFSRDLKQGIVSGLRVLPAYVNMSDGEMTQDLLSGGRRGSVLPQPGLMPDEKEAAEAAAEALADGADDAEGVAWHMLDPRYDGLVGNCECLTERDLGPAYFSVHFTCLPVTPPVHKPGRYENEAEFLDHVRTRVKGCMRFYFLKWYEAYVRAVGQRLPPPLYQGPPVRVHDPEADGICDRLRQEAYDAAVAEERRRNGQG